MTHRRRTPPPPGRSPAGGPPAAGAPMLAAPVPAAPLPGVTRADAVPDAADADTLAEWLGGALLADAGSAAWGDPQFVAWLADAARAADRSERRAGDAAFLARGQALLARAQARRLGIHRYPAPPDDVGADRAAGPRAVRERPASGPVVRGARVVPVVELGVAAGPGRDLWDEPPERWLRVPDALPDARYLALRVVGTSMAPMLRSGDVVLVRADARGREVRPGRVVVARHPDDGYVCKRVHAVGARDVALASLEPGHALLRLPRDPALVVGTVVAAWPGR